MSASQSVLVPRRNGKARPVLNFECLVHRINFEFWGRFAEIVLMAALMQPNSRELGWLAGLVSGE